MSFMLFQGWKIWTNSIFKFKDFPLKMASFHPCVCGLKSQKASLSLSILNWKLCTLLSLLLCIMCTRIGSTSYLLYEAPCTLWTLELKVLITAFKDFSLRTLLEDLLALFFHCWLLIMKFLLLVVGKALKKMWSY